MSHLQTTLFDNCTNQLNVSYYTLFYVHIRLTILTAGITKLAKATNITGELIIVREASAVAQ